MRHEERGLEERRIFETIDQNLFQGQRAVWLVLLFCDSCPKPNLPKDAIRGMAEAAEKELCIALGVGESNALSPSTIEKKCVEQVKALETSRKLPRDTPDEKWWWKNKSSQINTCSEFHCF